jgi:hypothetical protein
MWLKAPSLVLAAALAALAASSCGSSNTTSSAGTSTSSGARSPANGHLTVTPTSGHRSTPFTFSFTAPQTAGRNGTVQTVYALAVSAPPHPGCLADRTVSVGHAVKGTEVAVTLDPVKLGGVWCQGTYNARVTEVQEPYCTPGTMCPQFVRVVGTVGRTTFRVTA